MPPRKPASPQAETPSSPVSVTGDATGGVTVIGIDPGSQCTGWGVVREVSGVLTLVDCGAIRPKGDDFAARLGHLFRELHALVGRYAPDEAAIENVHAARNVATALKLGQARGVAVAACAAHGVVVADYQPTEIKKALVGTGGADKEQVSFMVARVLGAKGGWGLDTGDALAAAVCHLNARRLSRLARLG
ncbi:crossover junction endodeoxyribonuclease RuvC [Nitratidesulfovibrio oxamicus]|uniref:crossover junction endodeoxyribonuclease RuvC n=1 Tax=Nitratidesulfovibrio oxamicus TaxID=32016 RepID=UPI001E51760F|nr:crossover junction endodeoxyribonuclease RuvC [Nitratidesulfovibrio oxamicus]